MRVILENEKNINQINLPELILGNYWLTDSNSKNLLNIVAENNSWVLKSNSDVKISAAEINDNINTINFSETIKIEISKVYYAINILTKEKYKLFILPSYDSLENLLINYSKTEKITIGKDKINDICIVNSLLSNKQLSIELDKEKKMFLLKNLFESNKVFVNNILTNNIYLNRGDIIFINGIFIYFFGALILVSNNENNLYFNTQKISKRKIVELSNTDYSNFIDKYVPFFNKKDYFQRPPRIKRTIEKKIFNIDAPTSKEKEDDMPLIFLIAPMITMSMTAMISCFPAIEKVLNHQSTLKEQLPQIAMLTSILIVTIIFPVVQKEYNKRRKKKREKLRISKYQKYIDEKREEIRKEINYQKAVLLENNLPIDVVRNVILNKARTLWERKIIHDDFLNFRLGIGTKKPEIEIKYPEEHFSLDEDELKSIVKNLVNENKNIDNVPISLNFKTNNKVGIIGQRKMVNNVLDNIMLQIMAYHGYDELRIVILTNKKNQEYWKKYKSLPYLWNNTKTFRYFGTNKDNINKITSYLMEEYNYRVEFAEQNNGDIQTVPYYLVLTDDIEALKNNVFVNSILKNQFNLSYSIITIDEKLNKIPDECNMFVNVSPGSSGIFTSQMKTDDQIPFVPDLVEFSIQDCITAASNIPIDVNNGKFVLPKTYGFLDMFDVGNVNQLNIINRWKQNDIINSLETPIGIDEQGELFKIDIHEKAHGPHGLVAGMTGSGKSEWIITYILSLAINYSPEELQFVLIDYKGGELALTFDNRENGIKLPHVVGTLTNLDIVEMKRSLASINSELKRRQKMFKLAREKLNESSMDIYRYQELYREGKLDEPMSHLIIISDEFAELKSQQPEFMAELISTARIGRSLGVHLILATQKPSGVVDAQIWSNAKFRVCLKVQDKSDSNDMLKRPEAAMIKETGRFYFQVGFNEFFALGQSAYTGVPYYESTKKITEIDSKIDFIDDIGTIIKRGDIEKKNTQFVQKGEELPNILNYIIDTAKTQNFQISSLWLSSIPSTIYVDKLKEKYQYKKENFILNPVVGEYDEPHMQQQNILTVPISKEGNFLLCGSSGSGKELFITTFLYSLITTYRPEEVIVYILDFGTEVLNSFSYASHIGDIVHSGEDEKIKNLYKFINTEIKNRKKLFMNYNGNYADYVKNSEKKIPNIVIIINSFDVFNDIYEEEARSLYELIRDCNKYGIYFVLTANSMNVINNKLLQGFKTIYSLQLNNEIDYRSIYGNTDGLVPSKIYGRGLLKKDKVLEFQTAYPYEKDVMYKKITNLSLQTYAKYKSKAMPIPILPKTVSLSNINYEKIDIKNIPIGMEKENLNTISINLEDKVSYFVSFRSFDENLSFIDSLLNIINKSDINTIVFDSKYIYEEDNFDKIKYFNSGYNKPLDNLNKFIDDVDDILNKNNNNIRSIKGIKDVLCVIIGFDKFMDMLSDEYKEKFINIVTKSKESLKAHFIFIDIPYSFKSYEFETWYKNVTDPGCGLWIGNGFIEQNLIKPTKMIPDYYASIDHNFGYFVDCGQVKLIKLIEESKKTNK